LTSPNLSQWLVSFKLSHLDASLTGPEPTEYVAIAKQGVSVLKDAFQAADSITKDVISIKKSIENEQNREESQRAMKENTVSQAMDALKRLVGDKFNIVIANDYSDDNYAQLSGQTETLPLIEVDFGGKAETAKFRIWIFTGGKYDRRYGAVGHKWEGDGIQYWGGSEGAVQVDKNIVAGCMYLTFPDLPGIPDDQVEGGEGAAQIEDGEAQAEAEGQAPPEDAPQEDAPPAEEGAPQEEAPPAEEGAPQEEAPPAEEGAPQEDAPQEDGEAEQ